MNTNRCAAVACCGCLDDIHMDIVTTKDTTSKPKDEPKKGEAGHLPTALPSPGFQCYAHVFLKKAQ